MSVQELKEQLIEQIQAINDEALLSEVAEMLREEPVYYQFDAEQEARLEQAIASADAGNTVSMEEAIQYLDQCRAITVSKFKR